MDASRFDRLARDLVVGHSRRSVLKGLAAAAIGGVGLTRAGGTAADTACKPATGPQSKCNKDLQCCAGLVCEAGNCQPGCHIAVDGRIAFFAGGATNPANQCQSCRPDVSTTAWTNKPDGTGCNDEDACTQTDTCQNGSCVGRNPVICTALDQCHDAGTCDPANGLCSNPNKPNGTSCDDGNACTRTDTCQEGACVGSDPVVCTALDQCHEVGTCDPETGACSNPARPSGSPCDDGNLCTIGDTCQAGSCVSGPEITCTALDQCHDAGACDPATGECSNPARPDGAPCDDGNACTQTDTCQNGACVGGDPVSCVPCHRCNPSLGTCEPDPAQAGQACPNDGNLCFGGFQCTAAGDCVGVQPVVCTAPDQCHDASTCDPATGLCSNPAKPNGSPCVDGNLCTVGDTCQNGVCVSGSERVCRALDQCHLVGTCNPATGLCSNPAKPNGVGCDDGDPCTQTSTCQGGACVGSDRLECDDHDPCTIDTCAGGQCVHIPLDCNDHDPCTLDYCDNGVCRNDPINCDDHDPCTIDYCDNGECRHDWICS